MQSTWYVLRISFFTVQGVVPLAAAIGLAPLRGKYTGAETSPLLLH